MLKYLIIITVVLVVLVKFDVINFTNKDVTSKVKNGTAKVENVAKETFKKGVSYVHETN